MKFKLKHLTLVLALLLAVSIWHDNTESMSYSEAFHEIEPIAKVIMTDEYIMVSFKSHTIGPSIKQLKALAKIAELKKEFYIEQ